MLKALLSGVADMAHGPIEPAEQEPVKRVCAYLEAIGGCLLIAIVAELLF